MHLPTKIPVAQAVSRIVRGACALALCASLWTPQAHAAQAAESAAACPNDESGLTLPPGFCATVFADDIGHARHMAVSAAGVLYVNTWSGEYYGNDTPHAGG